MPSRTPEMAASAYPMRKIVAMISPVLTPMADAVSLSCEVALQSRPSRVRRNAYQVPTSTATPTIRISSWTPVTTAPPTCTVGRAVSYTHLRAHETVLDLVCRLLLEKKKEQHT